MKLFSIFLQKIVIFAKIKNRKMKKFQVVERTFLTSGNIKYVVQEEVIFPSTAPELPMISRWTDKAMYDVLSDAQNKMDSLSGNIQDVVL